MNKTIDFKKIAKRVVKYFAILVLVLILIYTLFGMYLDTKQDKILAEVNQFTKENFKGDIKIGDLSVLIFKDFPSLTIELHDITVKDSLWALHKKTLIDSDYLYAKIYPWKLLFGNLEINKITLKNATLDVHVEENGYSNFSALAKRKKKVETEKKDPLLDLKIDKIEMLDVSVIADNQFKKKSIHLKINKLTTVLDDSFSGLKATVKMDAFAEDLTFNFKNGSFVKNKAIKGSLALFFDEDKKIIDVKSDALAIGDCVFDLKADFGFKGNSKFNIHLKSNSVLWKDAASLVSNNIFSKLNKFDFKKPFGVSCDINGDLKDKNFLKIHVVADFKNNELTAVDQLFTDCSFKGEYTNYYTDNGRYDDENSAILLHSFKASYKSIPFVTKDLMILNLKQPIASGSIDTDFDAKKLNAIFNPDYLNFTKGEVSCHVKFKSDVVNLKIDKPFIEGLFSIKECDYVFVPKNIAFKKNNMELEFTSDELRVKNLSFETKKSTIQMKGYSKDFMSLYYHSPNKIVLNWEVYSPNLDLIDFVYFLSPTKTKKKPKKDHKDIFDLLINTQQITAKVKIDRFTHKKFTGTNLIADLELNNKRVLLRELSVNTCNGVLKANAEIDHGLTSNAFFFKVDATKLNVQKFLYSMDNFGSKTITNNSIRGDLSLQTNLTGKIYDHGGLEPNTLKGKLNFQLTNGAFVNFKPLENVGKHVFPARDFSSIKVDNLNGIVSINKGIVTVQPMQINTSVMKFDLAGNYGFKAGTDLTVDVYLRNPEKDAKEVSKKALAENRKKGMIIHLNVLDDGKGGTKIKPRLFNKSK